MLLSSDLIDFELQAKQTHPSEWKVAEAGQCERNLKLPLISSEKCKCVAIFGSERRKMSESKSEMPPPMPVGNLRNRIDNNLKLSIPKTDANFSNCTTKNQPSTAPALSGRKNQFGDLPMMKNLMKNREHDSFDTMGHDDYFVNTPGSSIIGTPSLKRKKTHRLTSRLQFDCLSEHSPLISQFMETSTPTDLSPIRFMNKLSPILQEQEVSFAFSYLKFQRSTLDGR